MGLFGKSLLSREIGARANLECCDLCEINCRGNRLTGAGCVCQTGDATLCFKRHISYSEELELLPSYMVYFAGCNFRCRFCVQAPASFEQKGQLVAPTEYARIFEDMVARGAKTINLVGGEPSLHVHTILGIAAAASVALPLVLNTNMFMSPAVLDLLEGVIDLYLADFKFGNDACARRIAGVANCNDIVTRNLRRVDPGRLVVRHLLLPGHVECCFAPVARWMAQNLGQVPFHVMPTYVQGSARDESGDLARLVSRQEIEAASSYMRELRLENHAIRAFGN